jgi:small subunit ribosomal protein S2
MGGLPDMLFVIDTNKEAIAVEEARRLASRSSAVVDSNSDPTGIRFPIPGNDDALRAIETVLRSDLGRVLDGMQAEMVASGVDIGEAAEPPGEAVAVGPSRPEAVVAAEAGPASAPAARSRAGGRRAQGRGDAKAPDRKSAAAAVGARRRPEAGAIGAPPEARAAP